MDKGQVIHGRNETDVGQTPQNLAHRLLNIRIEMHGIDDVRAFAIRRCDFSQCQAKLPERQAKALTTMGGDQDQSPVSGRWRGDRMTTRNGRPAISSNASMTVLPVTRMSLSETPSASKFARLVSVGAK